MADNPTAPPRFEFDLDCFTMAEKWAFNLAPEPESPEFLTRVVKRWPYEGLNPQNKEDYGKLTQLQWDDVVASFFRSINDRRNKRTS